MLYGEPGPFTEYKAADGRWLTPRSLQENLWANFTHLGRTIGAMTLAPGMAAYERLRALPDDTPVEIGTAGDRWTRRGAPATQRADTASEEDGSCMHRSRRSTRDCSDC
jgi:hypothetical protein